MLCILLIYLHISFSRIYSCGVRHGCSKIEQKPLITQSINLYRNFWFNGMMLSRGLCFTGAATMKRNEIGGRKKK